MGCNPRAAPGHSVRPAASLGLRSDSAPAPDAKGVKSGCDVPKLYTRLGDSYTPAGRKTLLNLPLFAISPGQVFLTGTGFESPGSVAGEGGRQATGDSSAGPDWRG